MQSIDLIETYTYGTSKGLVNPNKKWNLFNCFWWYDSWYTSEMKNLKNSFKWQQRDSNLQLLSS